MAGKIIADTIESAGSQISLNVGNVTILTASSTGLTLTPTTNVNINIASGSAAFTTANITTANITTANITGNLTMAGSTSGSVTLQAAAVAGTTTYTLPAATGTVMVSGNMPVFSAESTTSQNISSTTWTKVTVGSELFDTNNNFSSSRFTPTVAGYYQFNGGIRCNGSSITGIVVSLYKNGSIVGYGNAQQSSVAADNSITVSEIIFLNGTTDYVELYGFIIGTNPNFAYAAAGANARFSGGLVRAA